MYSKSTLFLYWFMLAGVLVASGVVAFVAPAGTEQTRLTGDRLLAGSSLVGVWDEQGQQGQYRVTFTPGVVFFSSHDEADICEIEVLEHNSLTGGGSVQGVVRLHRVGHRNLPLREQRVKIEYELRDEGLELRWDEGLELSPRLADRQLSVVPGANDHSSDPTR